MLTCSLWRSAPVVAVVAGLSTAGTARAQEMYRTSETCTGTITVDGVPHLMLAVFVQESGDSDGDGVPDYDGDGTFTGAVLVDRMDDPLPAFEPPPLSWFPELLAHIRPSANNLWNQQYAVGDGLHADTAFSSGAAQSMDVTVDEITPLSWSLSATVTGTCITREGITLPLAHLASHRVLRSGSGTGFCELITLDGSLVLDGDAVVHAHRVVPPGHIYSASTYSLLENYNELTGEFSGSCGNSFEMPDPCSLVDLNGDGFVEWGDYLEFLNMFEQEDEQVDYTGDGLVDFGDYLEFLNLFNQCRDF